MVKFFLQNNKNNTLIHYLLKKATKHQKYKLFFVTCYFSLDAGSKIIKSLLDKNISISEIDFILDKGQVLDIGKESLQKWRDEISISCSVNLQIFYVNQSALFHPKIYALLEINANNNVLSGSLVFSSANFTNKGLIDDNIEFFIATSSLPVLSKFKRELDDLNIINIDCLEHDFSFDINNENFQDNNEKNQQETLFRFNLLNRGRFLHNWKTNSSNYNLKENLRITFESASDWQIDSINEDLERSGFDISQAKTISKVYFELDEYIKRIDKQSKCYDFQKTPGIITFLGRWIPVKRTGQIYLDLDIDNFDYFSQDLLQYLQSEIQSAFKSIEKDYREFIATGKLRVKSKYVKNIETFKVYLVLKILKLFDSSFGLVEDKLFENKNAMQNALNVLDSMNLENIKMIRLRRIFSPHYFFDLPYELQDTENINLLYECLLESCHSSQDNKNKIIKAVKNADRDKDLSHIDKVAVEVNE